MNENLEKAPHGEKAKELWQTKIINRVIYSKGFQHQTIKALEEMSELSVAVTKSLNGNPDHENIAEEIADVEIMLAQLKTMFNNHLRVDEIKTAKLERLARNLSLKYF